MKFFFIKKNIIFIFFLSLLMFLFGSYLIYNGHIYFYINPIRDHSDPLKATAVFSDWKWLINSIKCFNLGEDIFFNNYCDIGKRPYIYGSSLLYFPFKEKFISLYFYIIPFSLIFLVSFFLNYFIKKRNFYDYLIILFIFFSTPVMLGLERGNFEIVIFFLIIVISLLKNFFIINSLILLLSSFKYYPAILLAVNFIPKINLKYLIGILFFALAILIVFYIDKHEITRLIERKNIILPNNVERVGMYLFSFYVLPELIKSTMLELNIFNENVGYNICLYLSLLIFLYAFLKIFIFDKNHEKLENFKIDKFEDRLFFLCSLVLITIYFFMMNYIYKEIFFLGLIPYLQKNDFYINNKRFKIIYYLIICKFILLTILWIIQTTLFSTSIYIKGFNIMSKGILDFTLMYFIFIEFLKIIKMGLLINYNAIKKGELFGLK